MPLLEYFAADGIRSVRTKGTTAQDRLLNYYIAAIKLFAQRSQTKSLANNATPLHSSAVASLGK